MFGQRCTNVTFEPTMSDNQGCFDQIPKQNRVDGIPEEVQVYLQISCLVVQKIWDLCRSIVKV